MTLAATWSGRVSGRPLAALVLAGSMLSCGSHSVDAPSSPGTPSGAGGKVAKVRQMQAEAEAARARRRLVAHRTLAGEKIPAERVAARQRPLALRVGPATASARETVAPRVAAAAKAALRPTENVNSSTRKGTETSSSTFPRQGFAWRSAALWSLESRRHSTRPPACASSFPS
jgi:hypothetical protein